jgi:hypothetical protein
MGGDADADRGADFVNAARILLQSAIKTAAIPRRPIERL